MALKKTAFFDLESKNFQAVVQTKDLSFSITDNIIECVHPDSDFRLEFRFKQSGYFNYKTSVFLLNQQITGISQISGFSCFFFNVLIIFFINTLERSVLWPGASADLKRAFIAVGIAAFLHCPSLSSPSHLFLLLSSICAIFFYYSLLFAAKFLTWWFMRILYINKCRRRSQNC